jgi:DNA-binding transcriptional LysR family regulator
MSMETRLLRSFQVLAEQKHFGRASRALHLSQPALTKQIRQLEEEVGAPLFVRGARGSHLTPVGQLLSDDVTPLLRHADSVLERARRAASGSLGDLRIGFGVATRLLVPRWVSRFRRTHPKVNVTLQDMSSPAQLDALERGALEIGFVRMPVIGRLETLPVAEDRLVLAIPAFRRDELAQRRPQELRDEAFVELAPAASQSYHAHVLKVCACFGFRPRVVQSAREFFTVLALVAAGMGIAVVPRAMTSQRVEGVAYLPLDVADALWQVSAAWVAETSSAVRDAFLSVLRADLARTGARGRRGDGG